jgi:hypothetical protein
MGLAATQQNLFLSSKIQLPLAFAFAFSFRGTGQQQRPILRRKIFEKIDLKLFSLAQYRFVSFESQTHGPAGCPSLCCPTTFTKVTKNEKPKLPTVYKIYFLHCCTLHKNITFIVRRAPLCHTHRSLFELRMVITYLLKIN